MVDYLIIIFISTNGCEQDAADEEAAGQEAETEQATAQLVQIQNRQQDQVQRQAQTLEEDQTQSLLIPYLNIRTSPITLYLRHPKQLLAAAHRRLLDWEKQTSWLGMVLG